MYFKIKRGITKKHYFKYLSETSNEHKQNQSKKNYVSTETVNIQKYKVI